MQYERRRLPLCDAINRERHSLSVPVPRSSVEVLENRNSVALIWWHCTEFTHVPCSKHFSELVASIQHMLISKSNDKSDDATPVEDI